MLLEGGQVHCWGADWNKQLNGLGENKTTGQTLVASSAIAVAAAAALVIGALSLRTRGVYFIMITLAFAQMMYYVFVSMKTYGGDDGLSLPGRSSTGLGVSLGNDLVWYYLVLALLAAVLYLLHRLLGSRFGRVIEAIRENETRAQAIGYPVYRYQLLCFVISGAIAGLAGALIANQMDIMIGPLNQNAMASASQNPARFDSAFMNICLAAAEELQDATNVLGWAWCVWSRANGAMSVIERVEMDDAPDVLAQEGWDGVHAPKDVRLVAPHFVTAPEGARRQQEDPMPLEFGFQGFVRTRLHVQRQMIEVVARSQGRVAALFEQRHALIAAVQKGLVFVLPIGSHAQ